MALLNWAGFRTAAWGGMGLLAAAILLVVVQGQWLQAATLGGFLAVALLFVRRERQLPTLFDLIFVGAALINAVGWAWDLFDQPGLYDEVAHGLEYALNRARNTATRASMRCSAGVAVG